MKQVPAIVHGDFKLSERFEYIAKQGLHYIRNVAYLNHTILRYLACAFPEVAENWYPSDLKKRAKVDSLLDWHHTNLGFGTVELLLNTVIAPALGFPPNPEMAARGEKVLYASLEKIEKLWLNDSGPFLLGNPQPSLVDLVFVCEIMQLELLEDDVCARILGPHEKVKQWIEATQSTTSPYFEEMLGALFSVKEMFQKQSVESGSK